MGEILRTLAALLLVLAWSWGPLGASSAALAATATATDEDGEHVAENVLDGDVDTRWSGNGIGTTLTVDLETTKTIGTVKLSFYRGDQRTASFDIQLSTNGSDFTTVLSDATSSGETVWNQSFGIPAQSARYVRFVNQGNSENNWGSLTKFSTSSATTEPEPSDCDVPADVLDLSNWKITIPFGDEEGTEDGNTVSATEITQPDLDDYDLSPYFTPSSDCDAVQFRAHAGGATTSGSGYPRSELREMVEDGSDEIAWDSDEGVHTFDVTLMVTHLPDVKRHITVAQIHDGDDDVLTFRVEGDILKTEIDGDDGDFEMDYDLDDVIELSFVVEDDVSRAYVDGDLVETVERSYSGAYFKTGAYTQSACGGSNEIDGESCSAYGEVHIFDLSVNHTGVNLFSSQPLEPVEEAVEEASSLGSPLGCSTTTTVPAGPVGLALVWLLAYRRRIEL